MNFKFYSPPLLAEDCKAVRKMFTVLICDKHIINDCHNKYYIYFKPFLDDKNFAFCSWNTQASSLDEAVPELKSIIRGKKEWRAIVVNDSSTWDFNSVNKRNPFNFVDSQNAVPEFSDFSVVESFRADEQRMLSKALSNPLVKLSVWLCGSPIKVKPEVCYSGYEEAINNPKDSAAYFAKLKELGLSAKDAEADRSRAIKFERLSEMFDFGGELFNPPQSFLAVSERAKDIERELADDAWKTHTEFDYSHFYTENLYPDKLRYLICDVSYVKGERNEGLYFNFLTLMLLLALNECPSGVLRPNRVYTLGVEIDSDCVRELCYRYNAKLTATLGKISSMSRKLSEKEKEPIDRDTARMCFETDVEIPVEVDGEFDKKRLMAEYDKIGLSKDCPEEEYKYWNEQYHSISKLFIRYLREPRRAVKTAAKVGLRSSNKISDERALQLNEFQREDIEDHLLEEELNMVSTVTTQLYNTEEYRAEIDKADKLLRREIGQRMTKRKTVFAGLIALVAYFLGFLPLFISNLNTTKSFLFSMGVTGVTLLVFMVIGFVFLFILRKRLVKRFKDFNDAMNEILAEIEAGLGKFSKYLSHACNVMRGFSVLSYTENSFEKRQNILNHHKNVILNKIKEVNELFSDYLTSENSEAECNIQPYDFDFAKLVEYNYEMPYSGAAKSIEFMQTGNQIQIPIDYVKSVSVKREELYD
ncbi:MAG: hypothetical protein J6C82_07765 [Clostridia bacterium]|nr:hypothetical protein [Clostridia bacterium]